jgi:hypothetical protein
VRGDGEAVRWIDSSESGRGFDESDGGHTVKLHSKTESCLRPVCLSAVLAASCRRQGSRRSPIRRGGAFSAKNNKCENFMD